MITVVTVTCNLPPVRPGIPGVFSSRIMSVLSLLQASHSSRAAWMHTTLTHHCLHNLSLRETPERES